MRKIWLLVVCLLYGLVQTSQVSAVDFAQKIKHSLSYTGNTESEVFTAWIISIPNPEDPTKWFTIMDRNLWATTTWAWIGNGSKESMWFFYQWWNNYWFPNTLENINTTLDLIDVSWYWSWTFYKSSILYNGWGTTWVTQSNYNLWWGWKDDTEKSYPINNYEERQWPCPDGRHIPSRWERNALLKTSFSIISWDFIISDYQFYDYESDISYFSWIRDNTPGYIIQQLFSNNLNLTSDREILTLRSSSPSIDVGWVGWAGAFAIAKSEVWEVGDAYYQVYVKPIRCFSNEYVQAVLISFKNNSDELDSWYMIKWHTWDKLDNKPTEEWHTFKYWHLTWSDEEFDFENTPIIEDTTLYAKFEANEYTITFVDGSWTNTEVIHTWAYGSSTSWIQYPSWTRNWYTLSWSDTIPDTMPLNWMTITASWTKKSSWRSGWWSSWWGGSNKTWDVQDSSSTPQNDSSVSSWTDVKDLKWNDSSDKSSEWQTWSQEILSPADDSFTKEQKDAYTFAFKNGITNMNTIDKANMDWYIKRGHLAKMVVNYVTNVLWREISSDILASCLSFSDEATARESEEIKDYAIKSCALWLMWINMKNNEFLPNDYVTRAEFGAVLSRILRWDKYNLVHTQEKPRYTDHLNALKNEWIMTKIDNPKMLEKRWYVMIMIMRSTQ